MCKIQEREYSIYRQVYSAMKGVMDRMSAEKTAEHYQMCSAFLMILGYVMYLVGHLGQSAGEGADPF